MTDMATVNSRLNWFVERMRAKLALPQNISKGDWRDMDSSQIHERVEEEVEELRQSYADEDSTNEEIISECCDVANFCMMLADKLEQLEREKIKSSKKSKTGGR